MKNFKFLAIILVLTAVISCKNNGESKQYSPQSDNASYIDKPFLQEFHDAYKVSDNKADNNIHSIAVDNDSNVWIATASGIFRKSKDSRKWQPVITGDDRGPAYSVEVSEDGTVLFGTWNGLFAYRDNQITKVRGPVPPVSVVCKDGDEYYALGPKGIWHSKGNELECQDYKIARSVRDAIADGKGSLWVATDAGIYLCKNGKAELYQNTDELISCYVAALSFAPENKIWAGVMGGVSIRQNEKLVKNLTPKQGIPSNFVNCISQSPEGVMWVGTNVGVVRFEKDGSHSLRFSKRWLTNDKVNDVAFDAEGNAWIATANGVSAIKRKKMTLADKQDYFYHKLMTRYMRKPWICGLLQLNVPGDTASWCHIDCDNDGEYTGAYLAMESFRYAVTKDEDALVKARKAFHFLKYLQEITGTDAFFARTIVPVEWMGNRYGERVYSEQQIADELVDNPRFKPVRNRWRKSKDGKWLWKGDTSSDEMDGHMMGYFYFYEYAANEQDKEMIRQHVKRLVDGLMRNNYTLVDIDGKPTRWGVWSPEILNDDPDWSSERSVNSFELLSFLKFAAHITGDDKYEKEYHRLLYEEGYLDNVAKLNQKNPAWQIYFDRMLEGFIFPLVLKYEKDPKLKEFYENLYDEWMAKQTSGEHLLNNMTYAIATWKKVNIQQSIDFFIDTPLDLVDWRIDHTKREDVKIVHSPILEEEQIAELPPASIRGTVRWDKNPWAAIHGNSRTEREPVFWLWPYWMARYLNIISSSN